MLQVPRVFGRCVTRAAEMRKHNQTHEHSPTLRVSLSDCEGALMRLIRFQILLRCHCFAVSRSLRRRYRQSGCLPSLTGSAVAPHAVALWAVSWLASCIAVRPLH